MSNQQIKFRAWDKHNKRFFPHDELMHFKFCLALEGGEIYQMPLIQYLLLYQGEDGQTGFIVQQFINALDKKSQQIFEGDILLWLNPDPYDNEEFVPKVVGYNSRTMGFRLYNFPEQVGKEAGSSFFPEDVEVIGNVFEGGVKDGINYGEFLKEK